MAAFQHALRVRCQVARMIKIALISLLVAQLAGCGPSEHVQTATTVRSASEPAPSRTDMAARLLASHNQARVDAGLPKLSWSEDLARAALALGADHGERRQPAPFGQGYAPRSGREPLDGDSRLLQSRAHDGCVPRREERLSARHLPRCFEDRKMAGCRRITRRSSGPRRARSAAPSPPRTAGMCSYAAIRPPGISWASRSADHSGKLCRDQLGEGIGAVADAVLFRRLELGEGLQSYPSARTPDRSRSPWSRAAAR